MIWPLGEISFFRELDTAVASCGVPQRDANLNDTADQERWKMAKVVTLTGEAFADQELLNVFADKVRSILASVSNTQRLVWRIRPERTINNRCVNFYCRYWIE